MAEEDGRNTWKPGTWPKDCSKQVAMIDKKLSRVALLSSTGMASLP